MFQVTRFDFGDASRDTTPLSARGDTPNGKEVGANDTQSMQLEELHRLAMARKQLLKTAVAEINQWIIQEDTCTSVAEKTKGKDQGGVKGSTKHMHRSCGKVIN